MQPPPLKHAGYVFTTRKFSLFYVSVLHVLRTHAGCISSVSSTLSGCVIWERLFVREKTCVRDI